ncbi:MAG: hypothetical protein ABI180_09860 [Microcoleus sp.]|jgi:hypothetical protein
MTDEARGWEHLNDSKKYFLGVGSSSLASLYTDSDRPDRTFVGGGYISKFPIPDSWVRESTQTNIITL